MKHTLWRFRRDVVRVLLLLITGHGSLATSLAQPVSTPMTAGRTANGITYFLPKTAFRFHLLIEKTTYEPGPFARYADRYLHVANVGQEARTSHELVGMEITQVGVRDTSKCYSLRLKGSRLATTEVALSDDGVLLAVNDTPITVKGRTPFKACPQAAREDAMRFLTADARSAGSTAKMAELTMRQMQDLQERRQQLITGDLDEAPQDERQLRLMIQEIDRQYAALRTLFVGNERRDTVERSLLFCPDSVVRREVLFRLSQPLGLVDADDLAGVPYYISIEAPEQVDSTKYPTAVNKRHEGLYVNVPQPVRLTVYKEAEPLAAFDFHVAQLGFVELRSGELFKRYVTHLQLHPITGALVKEKADISSSSSSARSMRMRRM